MGATSNILFDSKLGDTKTIDNMAIGQTTPAPGAFTTLSATGGIVQPGSGAVVTASTTHSLTGATQLANGINLVNAANANDAVKLPVATVGAQVTVITVGSTATPAIFPGKSSDTIDGGTAGASVTLTAAHRGAVFYCAVAGNWVSSQLGVVAS